MFKVKRRARSSRSQESDGSSHHSLSNPSMNSGSVQLKSILRKNDGAAPSKESSSAPVAGSRSKNVGFVSVHVREFERVISENPSCSSGASLGIGWAHGDEQTMGLEEYEAARRPRKQLPQLVLTRQQREEILIEWGATVNEIIDSIRANVKAKNQRRRTVSSLDRYDRFEEYMESASRRLKRTLLLQKPVRKQAEEIADLSERYSKVTYVDRSVSVSNSNSQQHTGDAPPRQLPRATESPCNPQTSDTERNVIAYGAMRPITMGETVDGARQHYATMNGYNQVYPTPLMNVNIDDDFSSQHDQFVPVQFIGVGDQPLQYYEHMELYDPQSQQYYHHQQPLILYPYDDGDDGMEDLTFDGGDDDGFESLVRDQSYWEVAGMDAPGIRRRMMAVVISEDGQYDAEGEGWDNSFTLQPPPHSNSIISRWE